MCFSRLPILTGLHHAANFAFPVISPLILTHVSLKPLYSEPFSHFPLRNFCSNPNIFMASTSF